jgi:hypothetical protein
MIELFDVCYAALKKLPFHEFCSVLCVLLERKCKDEGRNVKETAGELYRTIIDVNNKLGEL